MVKVPVDPYIPFVSPFIVPPIMFVIKSEVPAKYIPYIPDVIVPPVIFISLPELEYG